MRAHPDVNLIYVGARQPIPPADLIILPGSKNTRADLGYVIEQGWSAAIIKHLRYGGKLIGICGGFQMLGNSVLDPNGVEGEAGTSDGLKLLDISTELTGDKQLRQVAGRCVFADANVSGYEIHMGNTSGPALARPAFTI